MPEKKTKVKLGLKNLAILPSYFDYTFVHLRQKASLRLDFSPKFLSTLGPNPTRKAQPDLHLCALNRAAQPFYWYRPHLREKSYCGPYAFSSRLNSK